jgi:sugar lactone lactonase YvrE
MRLFHAGARIARDLAAGLAAVVLTLAPARGQEPDLRVVKAGVVDIDVRILPSGSLPVPLAWNLYRGSLSDVGAYVQRGDPDGRCGNPGTDTSIPLAREAAMPGAFYYLLSAVDDPAGETGLGTDSFGVERPNDYPCPMTCGAEVAPAANITRTEGLAIDMDGVVYYSQSGFLGRRRPGSARENAWVTLPGATTVWGIACRVDGIAFVGSPSAGGNLFRIDTTAASPVAQVLYAAAGGANGVTVGPDGAAYYSDFSGGHVYRVDDAGMRTQVTAGTIAQPNGLLFDDDGTLLVLAYGAGQIHRLTLDATMSEVSRSLAGTIAGSRLDGIAKDDAGRYLLTDNGGGRLLRTDGSFGSLEVLVTGVPAAANIAFGKGPLDCTDVYVASSGALGFFESDVSGRP